MRLGAGVIAVILALVHLSQVAQARERLYYISADEIVWNYAPAHRDLVSGGPLPPLGHAQIGWSYRKAIYRAYTDRTFNRLMTIAPADRYRGIVGPTIHAEVGDTVIVVFRNHTRAKVDIAPGGLVSHPRPAPVPPGGVVTYRWPIKESDGPGPRDLSSVLYTYESDVQETADECAGLIGPLIVTRSGAARPDGSPSDVDREIVALYSAQREGDSFLMSASLADPVLNPRHISPKAATLVDDNEFPSINGFSYGNMPMPQLRRGERVRWYLMQTSTLDDAHAPTWDGQTVLLNGNRLDSVGLFQPHMVVDMVPDDPGIWLLVCNFNVHLIAGMKARYQVLP